VAIFVYHTIKYGYLNNKRFGRKGGDEGRRKKSRGKGVPDALQRDDAEGKEKETVEKYGNFEA